MALLVGYHKGRMVGENHLPQPADHAAFDPTWDAAGHLVYERTLLADVQHFTHQNTQSLLCRDALNGFFSQSTFMSGITLTQLQHLALGFIELPQVFMGPYSSLGLLLQTLRIAVE